jgi:hypothetical protein
MTSPATPTAAYMVPRGLLPSGRALADLTFCSGIRFHGLPAACETMMNGRGSHGAVVVLRSAPRTPPYGVASRRKRQSGSALQTVSAARTSVERNPASPAIRMNRWREQSLRFLRQLARIWMMAAMALAACGTSPQSGPTPQSGGPAFEMTVLGQTACPAALDAASCVRVRVTNRGTSGDGRCL